MLSHPISWVRVCIKTCKTESGFGKFWGQNGVAWDWNKTRKRIKCVMVHSLKMHIFLACGESQRLQQKLRAGVIWPTVNVLSNTPKRETRVKIPRARLQYERIWEAKEAHDAVLATRIPEMQTIARIFKSPNFQISNFFSFRVCNGTLKCYTLAHVVAAN